MLDAQWIDMLRDQVEKDFGFVQVQREYRQASCRYEALRQVLDPDQREILDDYDYYIRQLEAALTRTAYNLGLKQGRKEMESKK